LICFHKLKQKIVAAKQDIVYKMRK